MSTLNIGVTGLNAANLGLTTTSHNIANVSTPGYSRQVIVQGSNIPVRTGAGFVGQGTNVQTIKRMYDQYLGQQVLTAQAGASEMDSYLSQISQIDNLLADSTAGISPSLSSFFKGMQDVAANPSSVTSRQSMLSAAQSLAARFQSLDQRMSQIREGVGSQITSQVTAINSYSKQIADVNQAIFMARAGSQGQEPNDLLDQRDHLIAELNKVVRVTTVAQGDGALNVFVGDGLPLVVGAENYSLTTKPASGDPKRLVVAMQSPGGGSSEISETQITGGTLGGLVGFRSSTLDSAQNALGRVAIALALDMNNQHQLGQDLNGVMGGNFFNMGSPSAVAGTTNTGSGQLAATFSSTASADLTTSDYQLTYTAANTYVMTRLSDNVSWTGTSAAAVATAAGQGFDLNLTGTANVGDTFKIEPTKGGGSNLKVAITDARNIAVAAPMRAAAATANKGTGSVTPGTVNTPPPPNANLQQAVTITFVDATHFNVTGTGTGNPTNVAFTAGSNISYNGWTIQISGAPAAGDVFKVEKNANGVSDSRNVVAMAALQTTNTMVGGSAGYQSAYAQMVSEVGNKARQVKTVGEAQQNLVTQASTAQQSMSGVNLDEEAANLLRFQQAYQASAKIISTAGTLFDTLLGVMK